MDPNQNYVEETEAELKKLSEAMDKLQSRAEKQEHDLKAQCMDHIKTFREAEPVAWQHLDAIRESKEEATEKQKHDVESPMGELKKSLEAVSALLGDQKSS